MRQKLRQNSIKHIDMAEEVTTEGREIVTEHHVKKNMIQMEIAYMRMPTKMQEQENSLQKN